MKRHLLAVLCIFLLSGCFQEKQEKLRVAEKVQDSSSDELVVVATNDFHAALDRAEALASVIRDLRTKYGQRMVYLDAGDQFQGSMEGNVTKGKAVVEFFNLLKPDAVAVGNHEFDYGPDVARRVTVQKGEDGMGNLKRQVRNAKYPVLSANLVYEPLTTCTPGPGCNALGHKTIFEPRVIFERGGKKVCVIGGTTPLTSQITSPSFLKGSRFENLIPVITAESKLLREQEKCDWVLLDVHEGMRYEPDGKTLRNTGLLPVLRGLPPHALDAVVGGHSHIKVQEKVNDIPVIQTGTAARFVGVIHLKKKGDHVASHFDDFVTVPDTGVAFDVTDLLLNYRRQALVYKRKPVGTATQTFFLDKTKETPLGNLVADALLDAGKKKANARFALINAGAIRTNLPAGVVTYDSVFKLMPFEDSLTVVELTGAELRKLLEIAFSGSLGMPSVSGLHVVRRAVNHKNDASFYRDLNGDGKHQDWERNLVIDVRDESGLPLQDSRIYRLSTISYLSEGGDFQSVIYDRVPPSRIHEFGNIIFRDILADYFTRKSPLNPTHFYSAIRPRIQLIQ